MPCQHRVVKIPALVVCLVAFCARAASTNDWPVYRHDVALSGVSPGRGKIVKPEVQWEYYLGAPPVTIATDRKAEDPNLADLDGDGTPEKFALNGKTLEVTDLSGKRLWTFEVSGHPLGGNVRVAKLFPDRKGQQILSFSSRMDTGEGQGYCFAFDKGATNGELAWTTGPLTSQYAATLIVDDVDDDGLPEIVTAPHYQVQIFNGQTGTLEAAIPVAKGRNYGMLLSRPRPGHTQKDIFVISDFVLHVECVRFEDGKWGASLDASDAEISPSRPADGGEGRGEEVRSSDGPSPQSSPHSFFAGRGSRPAPPRPQAVSRDGKWVHAWGKKYLEDENAARPQGREQYLRVGPNPVSDLDGDGRDELAYMLVDAATDDQWHLVVHDCETGTIKADLPGVWVWSLTDLDGDGVTEIIYTPTREKRPPTYCDLHVARLRGGKLADFAVIQQVRPVLMNATLPLTAHTIADEGFNDVLRTDLDGNGRPEVFVAKRSPAGRFEDSLLAFAIAPNASLPRQFGSAGISAGVRLGEGHAGKDAGAPRLKRTWKFAQRGHRLNLVSATPGAVRVNDLTAGQVLALDAQGKVTGRSDLGRPGGFTTLPIVVDLDRDGRNEIVLQNAVGEILALAPGDHSPERRSVTGFSVSLPPKPVTDRRSAPPRVLWSHPGIAMNVSPGYSLGGALCPQAADLDGDGKPEVLFAAEAERGLSALVCVDGRGKLKWRRAIPGCPWGGLQAGVDHWTFGRITGRPRGLDVYVDLHRRSKGSGEGWLLRGDTGEIVWQRKGIVAKESAMPFGGGIPAVADLNRDGVDDLVQMFFTVYGATDGRTGDPLFPPAYLPGPASFGKWLAYSEPTVADLNGDGRLDVYLNSRSYARGGYAAVQQDGQPLWAEFHNNDQGSDGLGPVGDFDGDGKLEIAVPVLNGTLLCLNAADGAHQWSIKTPVTGDVIAADVNGDGILELIFAGRDGYLRAVRGKDGLELWRIGASGKPVVADVDGDGWIEVLAVGNDGVLRVIGAAAR